MMMIGNVIGIYQCGTGRNYAFDWIIKCLTFPPYVLLRQLLRQLCLLFWLRRTEKQAILHLQQTIQQTRLLQYYRTDHPRYDHTMNPMTLPTNRTQCICLQWNSSTWTLSPHRTRSFDQMTKTTRRKRNTKSTNLIMISTKTHFPIPNWRNTNSTKKWKRTSIYHHHMYNIRKEFSHHQSRIRIVQKTLSPHPNHPSWPKIPRTLLSSSRRNTLSQRMWQNKKSDTLRLPSTISTKSLCSRYLPKRNIRLTFKQNNTSIHQRFNVLIFPHYYISILRRFVVSTLLHF